MASIFKIKRKKRVSYGVTYNLPDGTRIRKIIGNKWYEADEYRKKIEKELREGRLEIFTSKHIPFPEFAKEYLRSKKVKSTAKTYTTYFYCIDRILIPYFEPYMLHQITPQLFEGFIVESCKRGVSPLTVNSYLRVLPVLGEHVASVEGALRSAYKKARLSSVRPFHTLRQSFGGYLAMAGVSLYKIAKLMDHTFEQVNTASQLKDNSRIAKTVKITRRRLLLFLTWARFGHFWGF